MNKMIQDKPNYDDVCDLKDGYEAWKHTYEYRSIKYNLRFLHSHHSRWFVVEYPEETNDIVKLVRNISDEKTEFLYHICGHSELWKDIFYESVKKAENDIDWFLDDSLNELLSQINHLKTIYSEVNNILDKIKICK